MTMPPRTLRVEIARPLNMRWDELGTMLRVQRRVIPQLLQAGANARAACEAVGTGVAHGAICPTAGKSASTVTYQAIKTALARVQKGRWKPVARPALDLCGGMLSALSQRIGQERKKRPSYLGDQPIPIRKQELRVDEREGTVVASVKLVSQGRIELALRPSKGTHWARLRAIAAGDVAFGAAEIKRDERRKKWYLLIAHEREIKPPVEGHDGSLIVHRGVHNALTLMATGGGARTVPGAKLFGQLRKLEARMRDTRTISATELGRGAKGHGKRRRFQTHDALDNKRKRVVRTWCQQMAALVCKDAQRHGCGEIVIEDYGGIAPHDDEHVRRALVRFPLYQLKQAIEHRAELDGIAVREVSGEYISTTCPACSCQDEQQHNHRTGRFHCANAACGFTRDADFVAAINMLRRAEVDTSVWDARLARARKLADAAE